MNSTAGIGVLFAGVELQCSGNWAFRQVTIGIPNGGGTFDATVAETTASLAVSVSLDSQNHAVLSANDVVFSIGTVNVSFSGSAWDWLIDLLKNTIINALTGAVTTAFEEGITNLIDVQANALLANSSYAIPLPLPAPYNMLEWRLGLSSNVVFNGSYMGIPLDGDIVASNNPVTPPIPAPTLPTFSPAFASHYIQMYLSSYTPMSALYVLYTSDLLSWLLAPSQLPLGLNNTAAYASIAPGFPQAYPNGDVWIYLLAADMPTITIAQATGISIDVPVLMGFNVNTTDWNNDTTNAFVLSADVSLSANISVGTDVTGGPALMGSLRYVQASFAVDSSNVGPVSVGGLQTALNLLFDGIVVPAINLLLAGGLPLPSFLSDTALQVGDGFLFLGSNFTIPAVVTS